MKRYLAFFSVFLLAPVAGQESLGGGGIDPADTALEITLDHQRLRVEAQANFEEERTALAIELFERCLSLRENPTDRLNLSIATFLDDRNEETLGHLLKLEESRPSDPHIPYLRGIVARRQGHFEEAVRQLEVFVKTDPTDATSWYQLGSSLVGTGQKTRARDAFARCVELDPGHMNAYYQLYRIESSLGNADAAEAAVSRFEALREASSTGQQVTARSLEEGRYTELETMPPPEPEIDKLGGILFEWADPRDVFEGGEAPRWRIEGAVAGLRTVADAESGGRNQGSWSYLRSGRPYLYPFTSDSGGRSLFSLADLLTGARSRPTFDEVAPFLFSAAVDLRSADLNQDGRDDLWLSLPLPVSESRLGPACFEQTDSGMLRAAPFGSGFGDETGTIYGSEWADWDNDGSLDLLLMDLDGYWMCDASGSRVSARRHGDGVPSTARFVDLDHDGRLDVACGTILAGKTSDYLTGARLAHGNLRGTKMVRGADPGGWDQKLLVAPDIGPTVALIPGDFDRDNDVDLISIDLWGDVAFWANLRGFRLGRSMVAGWWGEVLPSRISTPFDRDADGRLEFALHTLDRERRTQDQTNTLILECQAGLDGDRGNFTTDLRFRGTLLLVRDLTGNGDLEGVLRTEKGVLQIIDLGPSVKFLRDRNPHVLFELDTGLGFPLAAATIDLGGDGSPDLVVLTAIAEGDDIVLEPLVYWNHASRNSWVTVRLEGIKNNKLGYGTRYQVKDGFYFRSGELWDPVLRVGIGSRDSVQVIRLRWPNGIVQNIMNARAGETYTVVEVERMAGSCPFLYAWTGSSFEFVSDLLGAAGVGFPTGDGGYTRPDPDEYVKVEGLTPVGGKLELRMTEQLEEVTYLDHVALIAIDHPEGTTVFPNERFSGGPPFPEFGVHCLASPKTLDRVLDGEGRDVTGLLRNKDRRYPERFRLLDLEGYAESHQLEFRIGPVRGDERVVLLLEGWTRYPTASSIVAAAKRGWSLSPPRLQWLTPEGYWEDLVANMGFPAGYSKAMILDLSGRVPPGDPSLRIVTNMRVYWDRISVERGPAPVEVRVRQMAAIEARLDRRGYPVAVDKDGRMPPTFRYDLVNHWRGWKQQPGAYTRLGEVLPLLENQDDRFVVMDRGDDLALVFDGHSIPEAEVGWKRSYFFRAVGYAKDADPHTAAGGSVDPLPFSAMDSYPPRTPGTFAPGSDGESYLLEWNTRIVGDVRSLGLEPVTP